MRTRYISLMLAAALMLTLFAGCGQQEDAQETGGPLLTEDGKAWISEFKGELDTSYMSEIAGDGERFYFSTEEYDEDGGSTCALWLADPATGEFKKLEGYEASAALEGYAESYVRVSALCPMPEGELLVFETVSGVKFELPEGFAGTDEEKYNYAEYVYESRARRLDDTGAELGAVDLAAASDEALRLLGGQSGTGSGPLIENAAVGPDGSLLLDYSQGALVLLGTDGEVRYSQLLDGWYGKPILMPDGRAGFWEETMGGNVLRCFDFEKPGFGEDIDLPLNAYSLYDGGGAYCVCYVDSSCIWGIRPEGGEPVQLASLINCGLDENSLQAMFIDDEGSINCLFYDNDDGSAQLARLKLVDASELPETTVLRLACFYLNEEIRRAVLDFNRTNSGVKIEVADYAQYVTEDDYSAGLTKLNVEILSGNGPDLFASDGLPIAQYGARGLLYDMYELIDSDPELSRESFFENILDAFATDGKLYTITPKFRIISLVGNAEVVGEEPGWTLEEMRSVIESQPQIQYVLDASMSRQSMLQQMLTLNLGRYVDWETGECSFDSEDFVELLEFCASLPEGGGSGGGTPALVASGKQLLASFRVADFQEYQLYEAMFGGMLAFKGYPSSDRAGNMVEPMYGSLSISSTCKDVDAAWSFVRTLLLEDSYDTDSSHFFGYPLNRAAYDAAEATAMEKQYTTDPETGEQVEEPVSSWSWDALDVDIYAMTEEEAQALRELIASVKYSFSYDETIMNMIAEDSAAFFDGDKSAADTAALIQNRVSTYVNEQK
mgnify:CR=1 FL=1